MPAVQATTDGDWLRRICANPVCRLIVSSNSILTISRYFEGVKNSAKRGELFGVKNIFRLQHDRLATKNTVGLILLRTVQVAEASLSSD